MNGLLSHMMIHIANFITLETSVLSSLCWALMACQLNKLVMSGMV